MLKDIDAIIFDLGGVIINLDTSRTIHAFAQISGLGIQEIIKLNSREEFHAYEKGQISDVEFRNFLRGMMNVSLTDNKIDKAWTAMILDLPLQRLQMLKQLSEKMSVFILSNTNQVHLDFIVDNRLKQYGLNSLAEVCNQDYYSHKMGKRKPDADIYCQVVEEQNLSISKTLFLDDNVENIRTAESLGFKTYLVPQNQLKLNFT